MSELSQKRRLRLHILFESQDRRTPNGSSYIRLIRPLLHPSNAARAKVTFGAELPDEPVDAVIVDRLWRDDLTPALQATLFGALQQRGTPLIYSIDDNLLDLGTVPGRREFPSAMQRNLLREFMRQAAGVIVSTDKLAQRLANLNASITVLPNQLDETLDWPQVLPTRSGEPLRIGYMGTFSHFEDLMMVSWPLRQLFGQHQGRLSLEVVGVAEEHQIKALFPGLPVSVRKVPAGLVRYPEFVGWMSRELQWDFAIAPLLETAFNASKSDIKALDYGLLGIPAVFSRVESYQSWVRDGRDGLLVDNTDAAWHEALSRMVTDGELRSRLARESFDRVRAERTLAQHAGRWIDAIEQSLAKASGQPFAPFVHIDAAPPPASAVSAVAARAPMTRQQKLLQYANLDGRGLEIGASFSPVLTKADGYNIEILDHATQEELIAKYKDSGVDVSRIEPVDYVWTGQPLDELIGKTDHYDYIIASHVIEHTPDMVAFFQQCERLLKPGGVLALAVPDERYCFDALRPVSPTGDVLQAHRERRSRHTAGTVFDHFSTIAFLDGEPSWHKASQGSLALLHTFDEAVERYEAAAQTDDYIDVHNWRFTPASFRLIVHDLNCLGLTRLRELEPAEPEGMEFLVVLEKSELELSRLMADKKAEDRLALALAARNEWAAAAAGPKFALS